MTRNRTKVWDLNYVTVIMSATTKTEATTTVHLRRIEEKSMFVSEAARDFVDETLESMSWRHAMSFIWSPDAGCAGTIWCGRRSTRCWPVGGATPKSCAPSATTTPSWTSAIR